MRPWSFSFPDFRPHHPISLRRAHPNFPFSSRPVVLSCFKPARTRPSLADRRGVFLDYYSSCRGVLLMSPASLFPPGRELPSADQARRDVPFHRAAQSPSLGLQMMRKFFSFLGESVNAPLQVLHRIGRLFLQGGRDGVLRLSSRSLVWPGRTRVSPLSSLLCPRLNGTPAAG